MNFHSTLKPAFLASLVFTLLLGIVYPLFMWIAGHLFFRHDAAGSLIRRGETTVGAYWIGQNFTQDRYFHPRPSSAGDGYDAANSSPSNLGPTSQKLIDLLAARARSYRLENNIAPSNPIPADAVTASGSGLDPHISPEDARLQAPRVAAARNIPVASVLKAIEDATDNRDFWVFGRERVHVLNLNLALDEL